MKGVTETGGARLPLRSSARSTHRRLPAAAPFVLSMALLLSAGVGTAAGGPLRHDPFARPQLEPARTPATAASTPRMSPPLVGSLRATLVDGKRSLANVDGIILKLGDELGPYRLVEVHEREAVFEYQGSRRSLSID